MGLYKWIWRSQSNRKLYDAIGNSHKNEHKGPVDMEKEGKPGQWLWKCNFWKQ